MKATLARGILPSTMKEREDVEAMLKKAIENVRVEEAPEEKVQDKVGLLQATERCSMAIGFEKEKVKTKDI